MPRRASRNRPRRIDADPGLVDRVLANIAAGIRVDGACESVGVNPTVWYRWVSRGETELQRREAGQPANHDEDPYADIARRGRMARAEAVSTDLRIIRRAAEGGFPVKVDRRSWKDPETGRIITEESVTLAAPDWRAAAWHAERADPAWIKPTDRVEVSGPGGVPLGAASPMLVLASRVKELVSRDEDDSDLDTEEATVVSDADG